MTDKEAKAFYNSKAWKDPATGKRIEILKRDHFECQDCRKRIADAKANGIKLIGEDLKIRRAEEVHHIEELKEHPELALDDNNLISLCTQCHNKRHGRYQFRFIKKKKRLTEERW
ncbi:MAG: HNH endonuclease [Roseburia sp.]|nr:HNH endonuclease [Roseburia sp.]MDY5884253.1 HNH endonuclease [Roseburia sp.]